MVIGGLVVFVLLLIFLVEDDTKFNTRITIVGFVVTLIALGMSILFYMLADLSSAKISESTAKISESTNDIKASVKALEDVTGKLITTMLDVLVRNQDKMTDLIVRNDRRQSVDSSPATEPSDADGMG